MKRPKQGHQTFLMPYDGKRNKYFVIKECYYFGIVFTKPAKGDHNFR